MKNDRTNKIYLDHAATTRTERSVFEEMLPYFREEYGNPSAIYEFATSNKKAVNQARGRVAELLGADIREVYFTSGGTESDNHALIGSAESRAGEGRHIITSQIEHHAVLHCCDYLTSRGYEISYLPVSEDGLISPEALRNVIRKDTILVSVMMANNEIGTIEPIRELCRIAHQSGAWFHTDAVQAAGQIPIDVKEMGVDLLSLSAHKMYGPKGVGALYIKEGIKIGSLLHGGAQERHRRAGTENVPAIIGFGKAAELAMQQMQERIKKVSDLRNYLSERVLREIPYSRINGHRRLRLPGNTNFCFQFTEGESLLILLDMKGICASSGSACSTGSSEPSHVLTAIGLPSEVARGSLRLTIGHENTKEEIDYVIEQLKAIVNKVRAMSQEYEETIRRK